MKIATWNVNSIRAREERLKAWLDRSAVDVLVLQETKVVDEDFPRELFTERGYSVEIFGQPTYNGVAIASRQPITSVVRGFSDGDPTGGEARLIAGTTAGLRVIGVYVVNGQEVDTPAYERKLRWLDCLIAFVAAELRAAGDQPLLLLGDFNIAPTAADLYDPERLDGGILASVAERERFQALLALGLEDLLRRFQPQSGLYTFWDYRGLAFQKRQGYRIDHILANAAASAIVQGTEVDKDERRGQKPSDHAPVFAIFP